MGPGSSVFFLPRSTRKPATAIITKSIGLGLLAAWGGVFAEVLPPSDLSVNASVPTAVTVSWTGATLRPYQLESSTNLLDWSNIGSPLIGSGGLFSVTDSPVSEPRKFYRLRIGAVRPGFDQYFRSRNDDLSSNLIPLGFTVSLFGKNETHCYVNNNGNITFSAPLGSYTPTPLQNRGFTIIAPFWADVDTRPLGSEVVRYSYDAETVDGHLAFGVNWVDVGYYSFHTEKLNAFQLVFIQRSDTGVGNFDIEFNFNQVLWETGDASSGVNGYGGYPSRSGLTNGMDRTIELAYSGQPSVQLDAVPSTGVLNHLTGLIYRSRNSIIPGRYVFQVRAGEVLGALSVDAGPNQVLGQGMTSAVLAGSASDPGGGALTVHWSVLSGPANVTFSNPDILNPTVTIPTGKSTLLQLTATSVSDPNVSASDIIQID